ncbi:MAG: AsmA family protein [Pseudohaliea sp.]
MATLRTLLIAALALVGVVLAGGVALFLSDRALFSAALYAVDALTPYRLELEAPVLERRARRFRAAGVRLYQQGHDGPPLLAVQDLELRRLLAILRRGDLRETPVSAASVQAYVDSTDSTEDPKPADWLRQTRWLPASLELGSLHVITRGRELRIVPLRNNRGHWNEAGRFTLDSTAQLPDKTLVLALALEAPAPDALEVSTTITSPADESVVKLNGAVTATDDDLNYRLALDGDYRRVESLLSLLDEDAWGFAGSLRLQGELTGDLAHAELLVSRLSLDNSPSYDFSARGKLRWRRGEPVSADLEARGTMADLGPFAALLGTDLSGLGSVDAELALDGSLSRPRVRHFEFTSRSERGLALTIAPTGGELFLDDQLAADLALALRVEAPSAEALAPWVTLPVPTGPWSLTGIARRSNNTLAVKDIELAIDGVAGGRLDANGAVDGIASAAGNGPRFRGLSLTIDAEDLDLATLASAGELSPPVPLEGRLSVKGKLQGDDSALAARGIDATVAAFGGTTRIRGSIANAVSLAGVDLQVAPEDIDPTALGDYLPAPLRRALAGGRTGGTFQLVRDVEDWRIDHLDLSLEGAERLDVAVTGSVAQLTGMPRARLEASYRIRRPADDPGIGLPPGDGTAVLDLAAERQLVGLHAFLGATDLTTIVDITRDEAGITGLRAEVNAPRLHLPDLARMRAGQSLVTEQTETTSEAADAGKPHRFARVPAYPLTLRLDIGDITGSNTRLRDFAISVRGAERRFTLDRFDVDYAGGAVHLRGVADFSADEAAISVAGEALSVPVTALAADLGYGGEIEGKLSVRGGLTTRGANREDLVTHTTGSIAGAVAEGYVEGAAFDLLMTDLLSWLLLGGLLQDNTNFECGMARFLVEDGVARSEDLYLATKHMIAQGRATLDFPQGELDVRIDPRARSRTVQIPSSVRIRGSMNDPAIIPSPIAATFDASAKLLFLIPELGMKLFGIEPGKGDATAPCAAMLADPDGGAR